MCERSALSHPDGAGDVAFGAVSEGVEVRSLLPCHSLR